jgi:hypothetical protein
VLTTLVKLNGKPISVGVGKYCFELVNGKVEHNMPSRVGSSFNGCLDKYNEAFELAELAVQLQTFDKVEEH